MATLGHSKIGDNHWTANAALHEIDFSEFTAQQSGTLTDINIYGAGAASGTIALGIYSDNNGLPGTLLASGTVAFDTTVKWRSVSINQDVVSGTVYWLAWWGNSSNFEGFYDVGGLWAVADVSSGLTNSWPNFPNNPNTYFSTNSVSNFSIYCDFVWADSSTLSENVTITKINPNTRNVLAFDSVTVSESVSATRTPSPKVVHFIYFIPTDKVYDPVIFQSLTDMFTAVRSFYGNQLRNGFTFSNYSTEVEVVNAPRTSAFYASLSDSNYGLGIIGDYQNAPPSGNAATDKYVIFTDTPSPSGIVAGITNAVGGNFCSVSPPIAFAGTTGSYPVTTSHELGHSFGLNHTSPANDGSVMDTNGGNFGFPNAFFDAAALTNLRANSFFTDPFTFSSTVTASDTTTVSETVTLLRVSGANLTVFAQEVVTMVDQFSLNTLQINILDVITMSDNGIEEALVDFQFQSVVSVENPITMSDGIVPHYQDTVYMTDSLSYYQDSVFVYDAPNINVQGYGYPLDIENIVIQGLRIIGD